MNFQNIKIKSGEFTGQEWVEILAKEHCPSKERVIIVGKFSPTLRINKEDRKNYFDSSWGISFKNGKEIQVIPGGTDGFQARIPQWARHRLAGTPGDRYCVTERGGRYYLKKLQLLERPTIIPGCTVIDSFDWDVVKRTYSISTDFQKITDTGLERLLSLMGKFRCDPLAPFKKMSGKIGYLARKELMEEITKTDQQFVHDYKKQLRETQLEDGSWNGNPMTTAFNLMRLIEVGTTIKDKALEKGAIWLLATPEPLGFPGLFMLSEKLVTRFNAWKEREKRGKSGRPHRKTTEKEAQEYLEQREVLSSISAWPCELRLTWTSGIAIEALLRCGLHQEPRVVRAINTLLKMNPAGNWCGCGYFDTRNINFVPESSEPINFNQLPVFKLSPHRDDIARVVCNNYHCYALDIGNGQALLTNHYRSTGECSLVVKKALSYHPKYPGSNFEINTAITCMQHQGVNGAWGDTYLSTAFGLLKHITHPLSAFLVLRSIPLLIRKQGAEGLWQENQIGNCPPPKKEESTLMILRALKKFDFLKLLI